MSHRWTHFPRRLVQRLRSGRAVPPTLDEDDAAPAERRGPMGAHRDRPPTDLWSAYRPTRGDQRHDRHAGWGVTGDPSDDTAEPMAGASLALLTVFAVGVLAFMAWPRSSVQPSTIGPALAPWAFNAPSPTPASAVTARPLATKALAPDVDTMDSLATRMGENLASGAPVSTIGSSPSPSAEASVPSAGRTMTAMNTPDPDQAGPGVAMLERFVSERDPMGTMRPVVDCTAVCEVRAVVAPKAYLTVYLNALNHLGEVSLDRPDGWSVKAYYTDGQIPTLRVEDTGTLMGHPPSPTWLRVRTADHTVNVRLTPEGPGTIALPSVQVNDTAPAEGTPSWFRPPVDAGSGL